MRSVRRLACAFLLGLSALGWSATGGYSRVGMTLAGSICVDAATGEVLSQDRPDGLGHPASVTKLMTMLLVLEDVQAGKTTLSNRVTVTKAAAGVGGVILSRSRSTGVRPNLASRPDTIPA